MNRWSEVIAPILVFPRCRFQEFEHAIALFGDSTLVENLPESKNPRFRLFVMFLMSIMVARPERVLKEVGLEKRANPVALAMQSCVHDGEANVSMPVLPHIDALKSPSLESLEKVGQNFNSTRRMRLAKWMTI